MFRFSLVISWLFFLIKVHAYTSCCSRCAAGKQMTMGAIAVMLFLSGTLLIYTAVIVPVQICLWSYDDPCNIFPTLQFDIVVDTFFLVRAKKWRRRSCHFY
jgi:hypothetical protein